MIAVADGGDDIIMREVYCMVFDGGCDGDNRLDDAIGDDCERQVGSVKGEESRGGFWRYHADSM